MNKYRNLGGNSGVIGYDETDDTIIVYFKDGWKYVYSNYSAGINNIITMKKYANQGMGLNSFINKYVKKNYSKKFR